MSKLVSFAGLVGVFVVAHYLERILTHLRLEGGMITDLRPYLWFSSFAVIILSIALMLLSWYVVFRLKRDTWVASVFVVVGLASTFAWAIDISLRVSLDRHLLPSRLMDFFVPNSYVQYAAAFVAVIGIASFLLPRRHQVRARDESNKGEITPT